MNKPSTMPPILLVEDNPMDLDLTLRAFNKKKFSNTIQIARDGEEALAYFPRWEAGEPLPAVILLDINLPKVNGLEVLQKLETDDTVLLVSHQPLVGSLISFLQHGHLRQPQPMHTASLAELEGDFPLAGQMNLVNVKNP